MSTLKCFKLISKALDIFFKELPDPSWILSKVMPSTIMMANIRVHKDITNVHSEVLQTHIKDFTCSLRNCQSCVDTDSHTLSICPQARLCTHTYTRTNTHKHRGSSLIGVDCCSPHQSYSSSLYLCTANPPLLWNHPSPELPGDVPSAHSYIGSIHYSS